LDGILKNMSRQVKTQILPAKNLDSPPFLNHIIAVRRGGSMEAKIKHLELIQTVISRMARNSFILKGWGVTLISAIFALTVGKSERAFVWAAASRSSRSRLATCAEHFVDRIARAAESPLECPFPPDASENVHAAGPHPLPSPEPTPHRHN